VARILVVEDDRQVGGLLRMLLAAEGHQVTAVESGEDGVAEARRDAPDLVLLDVVLPGMNGFKVCRTLKADPALQLTPVVLLTGLGDVQHRVNGIEAGADDFISKPFDRTELLARVRSLLRVKAYTDALESAELVLFALARSIEARDPYTRGHCERLMLFGGALARAVGLDADQVRTVELGATVHDIGKIALPDSILLKEGPLTPEERALMQQHPVTGETICKPMRSFQKVLPVIRHHHERLDGSGYPDGLVGDEIPATARVLQVVDVFDALTTVRPYKAARTVPEAVRILRTEAKRGWWDRDVVEAFVTLTDADARLLRAVGVVPGQAAA
jgi:putative two-component system response regulator